MTLSAQVPGRFRPRFDDLALIGATLLVAVGRRARARLDVVTAREREVLLAVARGNSNAHIGRELYLSEATVKAHVSRLLTKLDADNRVHVAILAHDAGLLDDRR